MVILNWGDYNYDTERDCFVCKQCDFKTSDEDEMLLHIKEHKL